jgi:AbrB family looped-hinge helix DNA binding protein
MNKANDQWHNQRYRVRVAAGGRIVIPAEVRQVLGVKEGDELILYPSDGGYRVSTVELVVKEAQAYFRQFKRPGTSVVDELITERRQEAATEEGGTGSERSGKRK